MPIQPADPELRRRTLFVAALSLAVACAGFLLLQHWLSELHSQPPRDALAALLTALRLGTYVTCALLVGFAAYLWRFAGRVLRDQRFPPHGQRVIRDTPVLEGAAALRRATVLRVLAVILTLSSFGLLAVVSRLVRTYGAGLSG